MSMVMALVPFLMKHLLWTLVMVVFVLQLSTATSQLQLEILNK